MRGFQANNCRLCQKVFCCKKCRIKHEKDSHKVFPDCDICVYGKFLFASIDENFLRHLESSHLPVHCVYCKKVFNSVEDLLQHKNCDYFQTKEHSPKTPFKGNPSIRLPTDDNNSPIFQEVQRQELLNQILATSTPMHIGEGPNLMFDKSKEAMTPVDKPIRFTSKSIIKKTDSAKSDEQLSKRRVTFGEAPSAHTIEKEREDMIANPETPSSKFVESLDGPSVSNGCVTPGAGITSGQFYSAKTETGQFYSAKTDVSSKPERGDGNIKKSTEGFTPVSIPNRSKLINVKGDIYRKQDQDTDDLTESKENVAKEFKNDNFNEVSMELCTPRPLDKHSKPSESIVNPDLANKKSINTNGHSSLTENVKDTLSTQENTRENAFDFCTPAKTLNTGKIAVKGDIYKISEQDNISVSKNQKFTDENDGKKDNHNNSEDGLDTKNNTNSEEPVHDTLWLSAINLGATEDDSEQQNIENTHSLESSEQNQDQNNLLLITPVSPPRNSQTRVSIVKPTPILKTTNLQMKFHFPAHLSSTPIMSSGAVKLKQTTIVQDISTKVMQQQTPYKTPQAKLCELIQRKLVDANRRRILAPPTDIEAGPSTAGRVPLENVNDDYYANSDVVCRDNSLNTHESETGVSVSSMTESNLWTSMTRIVKSVLGGFSTVSRDSNDISSNNNTNSFKRQLSDSDTGDFLEAPRPKRFKFTDIKCRKSIRDLGALELPRRLPAPAPSLASIEIVKSVSTFYGHQAMKIQCDKATQTDNYLMYGWHPLV